MKALIAAVLAIVISGQAVAQEQQQEQHMGTFGNVVTSILGGVIMNKVCRHCNGNARMAATVGGAFAGNYVGHKAFDTEAQPQIQQQAQQQQVQQPVQYQQQPQVVYVQAQQAQPVYVSERRTCDNETQIDGKYNPRAAQALCRGRQQHERDVQAQLEQDAFERGARGE